MKIQVLGTGCDKCDRLYENVCEAVRLLALDAEVEKVEDLMEIVRFGVLSTPAMVVNGKQLIRNRIPSPAEIADLLRAEL